MHVEVSDRPKLAGEPLQLVVQAAAVWRQQIAEQAQRRPHATRCHAHLVNVVRVGAGARTGRVLQEFRGIPLQDQDGQITCRGRHRSRL